MIHLPFIYTTIFIITMLSVTSCINAIDKFFRIMSDSESGSRSSTSINGDYQANNSDNEKIDAERLANNGKDFEDEGTLCLHYILHQNGTEDFLHVCSLLNGFNSVLIDISSENDAEGSEALKVSVCTISFSTI